MTRAALGEIAVALPPLMPPGDYVLAFVGWDTVMFLNRQPKVALSFRVVDQGPYFDTQLKRWYNAAGLRGGPRRNGGFKLGGSSDLFRDFIQWTGLNPRKDRIALSRLSPLLFRGTVGDVLTDRRQRRLPQGTQYSVLREIRVISP